MARAPKTQTDRFLRFRARLTGACAVLALGVVAGRAAVVQMFDDDRLSKLARRQTEREIEFAPRRGLIQDREGRPLAVTQDVDSVFADPGVFETDAERAQAADLLANALQRPRGKLLQKLATSRRFVWLARGIEPAAADKVRALLVPDETGRPRLKGVSVVQEPRRFYPQRELAAQVLGFAGHDKGQEGLELQLDDQLRGKSVASPALRDARGRMTLPQGAPDPSQLSGATVTLTLDSAIQLVTERELKKAVTAVHAAAGWAVVMDVQTGALLALAGSPSADANKPGRDPLLWRNRAVQDQLEPGSTIKSFVWSVALDEGVLDAHETLDCEKGAWRAFGHTLHDTHTVGLATPTMALKESSNICAAKIGLRLGKERLVAGLRAFGFGEKSGVGLPGEGRGALRDPAKMPQISVATTAFGQGMSATGLQTVAAMAAIANGGVLLKPYLVEKVVAPDGKVVVQRGREEVRRVLKPETARLVTSMLEEVVQKGGTGTKAALTDFRVAGKTGTAQKVDPIRGGYGDKRLGSFLGFVPADAPRLAILVAIDEPEGKVYGGDVAAPAWGAIASESLRQLGVTPKSRREDAPEVAHVESAPEVQVAAIEPAPAPDDAEVSLAKEAVTRKGRALNDDDEDDDAPQARRPALKPGQVLVPDVMRLPARGVVSQLSAHSLEADLRGSGLAVAQAPPAGKIVQRGARVRVTLAPPR